MRHKWQLLKHNLQVVPIRNDTRDSDATARILLQQREELAIISAQLTELKNRPVEVVERIVEKSATTPPPTSETTPKPLSDNTSRISTTVEVVENDNKNLIDATTKQWIRSFTSKTVAARELNENKAKEGIQLLQQKGYTVDVKGQKISIYKK